jgi:hypothetical protein
MKNFFFYISCLIGFIALPVSVFAGLQPLENEELDQVTGMSGIVYAIKDVQIFQNIGLFQYCGSDGGYLALTNLQSDVMRYNFGTAYTFATANDLAGLIFFDVGVATVASLDDFNITTDPTPVEKGMIHVSAPNWQQEVSYQSDGILFSDGLVQYDLGAFWLGQIREPSFQYYLAPHECGSGLDFEYDFEMHIDGFEYAYQMNPSDPTDFQSLIIDQLHIGQSFDYDFGALGGDDPADPSTWKTDIGEFKIGNIIGNLPSDHARPAQIDAGVHSNTPGNPLGSAQFRLPMTGSLRFEKAVFTNIDTGAGIRDIDFGPGAIDGIRAYRMDLYLTP